MMRCTRECRWVVLLWVLVATPWSVRGQAPAAPSFLGVPATKWLDDLNSKDAGVRRSAAFALGKMGLPAAGAAPDLVAALREDLKPSVREAAAFALGEIGPTDNSGPILDALLKGMKDNDAKVRRSAAFALGRFGARNATVAVIGDKEIDPNAIVLDNARKAAPALQEALMDREPIVRQSAAFALGDLALRPDPMVVQALSDLADRDEDALVRRDSVSALGRLGSDARKAIRVLLARFRSDEDGVVRRAALDALVDMVTSEDVNIADDFRRALSHRDPDVVRNAALGLANIGGPTSSDAVPVLRKLTANDEEPDVRRLAFTALANIGLHAEAALPDFVRALKDDDPLIRRSAAVGLAKLGPKAKEAVPPLLAALSPAENPEEKVRMYCAEALANIDPNDPRVVKAMLKLLDEVNNYLVRHRAIWALERLRDFEQPGVVDALARVLIERGNEAKLLRYEAAKVLAVRMDERAPRRTLTVLLEALGDDKVFIYSGTVGQVGATKEGDAGAADVRSTGAGDWRRVVALAAPKLGKQLTGSEKDEMLKALEKVAKTSPDAEARAAADDAFKEISRFK